jgi:hypothetical protein
LRDNVDIAVRALKLPPAAGPVIHDHTTAPIAARLEQATGAVVGLGAALAGDIFRVGDLGFRIEAISCLSIIGGVRASICKSPESRQRSPVVQLQVFTVNSLSAVFQERYDNCRTTTVARTF